MRELLRKRYHDEKLKQTDAQTSEGNEGPVAYGSRMLSNLARGRHRSLDKPSTTQFEDAIDEDAQEADVIDLIDAEDDEEEAEADQERLLQGEEVDRDYDSDENSDNSSEYEIDTEALEEINKMVSGADHAAYTIYYPINYRPVTLLHIMSKVMETAMNTQLLKYLANNNIIHDRQYDFRKHRSTADLLAYVTHMWNRAIENHGESRVVASG
nr:unnamed protein product [Callosobruchus analis]